MLFLKHIPDELMDAWRIYRSEPIDFDVVGPYCQIECHAGYLLSLALSGRVTPQEMESEIDYADRAGVMVRDWFGLHYPVRYLPKNCYQSYLKSILVAKDYPLWLQHWQGLQFESAVYDETRHQATIKITTVGPGAKLECGTTREPTGAMQDGCSLPFESIPGKNRLTFRPTAAGTLIVTFTPLATQAAS